MAVLNSVGIKSPHIPFTFTTRNLIGCLCIRSNLIGVTYIHLSLTHSLTHSCIDLSITYPTRRLRGIFFQKNNSEINFIIYIQTPSSLYLRNKSFLVQNALLGCFGGLPAANALSCKL